jgi:predicted NAD/FAD-binding protein
MRSSVQMLVRCIKAQVDLLENEITDLENEHSVTFDDSTLQQLDSKRLEYNTLTTHEVENTLRRTKQNHYEHGDKAGKLLPWQIR